MKIFKSLISLLLLMAVVPAVGATDYATLETKAGRFYQYDEWPSALAMYQLMLEQRPEVPSTYAHAIIAAGMERDTDRQAQLLEQSMKYSVPLDSIYDNVRTLAFEQGQATLFEDFLENAGNSYPWLRRNIDARLLQYYTWRRNACQMITYSLRMLDGMPDDTGYLTSLADGYMLVGDYTRGIDTYRHILGIDPDNYHALLIMGNWYEHLHRQDRFNEEAVVLARQYLQRAESLHSTPYVTALLDQK